MRRDDLNVWPYPECKAASQAVSHRVSQPDPLLIIPNREIGLITSKADMPPPEHTETQLKKESVGLSETSSFCLYFSFPNFFNFFFF